MYHFLRQLLSDKKGGEIFTCFGAWHICFIFLFLAIAILSGIYLRHKSADRRKKLIDLFIYAAFGLYVADFFLMPFAYGEIDIEKLPFHVCTSMCVACFLSRRSKRFGKYKLQLAALGFLSNFVYLVYPAGVMWHAVHPLSYRVIQTLSFHGIMMVYGALVLVYERETFAWKKCYRDLGVTAAMTLWALVGNLLYNSDARVYNWFFVVQDPFNLLPQSIAPYIMPLLNICVFFAAELLVYFVFSRMERCLSRCES